MNTTGTTNGSQFASSLVSFRLWNWICAFAGAVLLNSALFLLLPMLMDTEEEPGKMEKLVEHIQVIRLKKEEPPPQRKKQQPTPPPEEQPKPREMVKAPSPPNNPRLTLPFKLNTRLPSMVTDFQMNLADNIRFGRLPAGAVNMEQLDEPLTTVARIPPVYPLRARRRGIEGFVRVAFEVDEQGFVVQPHIIEADPPDIFDNSVIRCVSKWRYRPGTVEGVAVRAKMETTIRFEMEK